MEKEPKKQKKADMRPFLDYENISGRIVYKLVNTGQNRELLEDIPHMEFLDLSIVFQCLVEDEPDSTASVLVYNLHLKIWGITAEDLYMDAVRNTPRLMGYEFKSMKDVLLEIMESEPEGKSGSEACMAEIEDAVPMYVLSNRHRIEGAACILYPALLRDICGKLESSFYVIPSSVHEVLILPADNTDESGKIRAMIKEVNDTQVAPEEILSYSLYYYDKKGRRLNIVPQQET